MIGLDVGDAEQRRILAALGAEPSGDDAFTVPTWRSRDVTREIDLIEEVARFELAEVPFTLPVRRHMTGRLTRV